MIWNDYWFIVWFSPAMWALVGWIDAYLSHGIFQDKWDGAVISSVFLLFPAIIIFILFPFMPPNSTTILTLVISGVTSSLATLFYFSALKNIADVVMAESLNSIAVLLVPILSYILFNIKPNLTYVVVILIAFFSAFSYSFIPGQHKLNKHKKLFRAMIISVLFLGLSIALADNAYTQVDFYSGFIIFSISGGLTGILFWTLSPKKIGKDNLNRIGIIKLVTDNFPVFFISEVLAITATFTFQRSLLLGDAGISTIIESTNVMMLMVLTLMISLICKMLIKFFPNTANELNQYIDLSALQFQHFKIKIPAIAGMILSIYLAYYEFAQ